MNDPLENINSESLKISVIGLPESGKTTFLAALWHLVNDVDSDSSLNLKNLLAGNSTYLNEISSAWRKALVQQRTESGVIEDVCLNLVDQTENREIQVNFPDTAGEAYREIWENRSCDSSVVETLHSENILLFIHSDSIKKPHWIVEQAAQEEAMGIIEETVTDVENKNVIAWHPSHAPTQVQIVELLQLLEEPPFDRKRRKIVVILSAWDKVEAENLTPAEFVAAQLPLLDQYLHSSSHECDYSIFGVSAQGGDYEDENKTASTTSSAEKLRNIDNASDRIKIANESGENLSHDITKLLTQFFV